MLTDIQVTTPDRQQDPLDLPLFNAGRFPISFVDGLDPGVVEMSSAPYANIDGEHYYGSRVGPRNIVLTLELGSGGSTHEDPEFLRSILRRYFTPGGKVNLRFSTTMVSRHISGVVESFEAPLFVQRPAVQISIMCFDPFFYAEEEQTRQFANIANGEPVTLPNGGDVPVGFRVMANLDPEQQAAGFRLRSDNKTLLGSMVIAEDSTLHVGTEPNNRYVLENNRDSRMNQLVQWDWPVINPGSPEVIFSFLNSSAYPIPSATVNLLFQYRERFTGL